jgi:Rieske Fe-S protein
MIAAGLALPTAAYLFVAGKSKTNGNLVESAKVTQLKVGKPQEVTFERTRVDGWRTFQEKVIAWVVRTGDRQVVAYSAQCTHLGCAYHWEAGKNQFVCPCHGSTFSIDGKVMAGPAARPLDRYVTRVKDDNLLISPEIWKG